MSFDEPDEVGAASGLRLNPKDILGHLLMVWVVEHIPHSQTKFSRPDRPSDVIVCDIVDLDLADENGLPGLVARKNWWRQGQLIQALKSKVGKPDPLLVRMGLGTATPGFNAPYQLFSVTSDPATVQRAQQWLHANPAFRPSVPGFGAPPPPPSVPFAPRPGDPHYHQQMQQGPPSSHWTTPEHTYTQTQGNPAAYNYPPQVMPPAAPPPRQETMLERIAREAQEQGQRNPGFEEKPPW